MQLKESKTIKKVSIFANSQKAESSILVQEIDTYLKNRGIATDIYLTSDAGDIKGTSTDRVSNFTKVRASMKRDTDGKYWSRSIFGGSYALIFFYFHNQLKINVLESPILGK
jgi:hypothetical protein